MKKILAAITAGGALVASQSALANADATSRVGDRVGATSGESSEFSGVPLPVLLVGAAIVVATVVVATDDDSESD